MNTPSPKLRGPSAFQRAVLMLLRAYKKFVSPLLPPACRFQPTCSEYAAEAVQYHGVLKGSWLALRRLLRCHPFHRGGFDPVPSAAKAKEGRPSSAKATEGRPACTENVEAGEKSTDTCAG